MQMKNVLNILCIEDNFEINSALRKLLSSEGHNFIGEVDGKRGLQLIQENQFDLVLLDLTLTGLNMEDIINILVLNGSLKNQTVIAMTAHLVSDEEKDEMIKKGIRAVLQKPFSPKTLLDTINNLTN